MTTTETFDLLQPYRIAEETFVIPWALEAPPVGHFPMNSMVIRGAEPVLVDTGAPAVRSQWLEAAWSVVDPLDVRWIFLTHDDRDHAGNLLSAVAECPNATLLTTWFSIGRMAAEWETPINRYRFMTDGDTVDVGDRTLVAQRPPLYDNPTTRALFDTKTKVMWSVDTFATKCPLPCPKPPTCPRISSATASSSADSSSRPGWRCWTTRSSGQSWTTSSDWTPRSSPAATHPCSADH